MASESVTTWGQVRARAERGEMTGRWGLDTRGGARRGAAFSDGTRTA